MKTILIIKREKKNAVSYKVLPLYKSWQVKLKDDLNFDLTG